MDSFLFSDTVSLLARSVDLRAKNHNLIAGNIANAETPGYTPKSLSFEKQLKAALDGCSRGAPSATRHADHLPVPPCPIDKVMGTVIETPGASPGMDGNGVDLDAEMAKMAENQIMYHASVQLLARKLEGLKSVIRGGN